MYLYRCVGLLLSVLSVHSVWFRGETQPYGNGPTDQVESTSRPQPQQEAIGSSQGQDVEAKEPAWLEYIGSSFGLPLIRPGDGVLPMSSKQTLERFGDNLTHMDKIYLYSKQYKVWYFGQDADLQLRQRSQKSRPPPSFIINSHYDFRYKIEMKLGQGAFSTVYKAQDYKNNAEVVLKVAFEQQTSDTPSPIQYITLECDHLSIIHMSSDIGTQYIVKPVEKTILEYSRTVALVLPLLNDYTTIKNNFQFQDVQRWTKQILLALKVLQLPLVQLCHHDIKPDNILFKQSSDGKLDAVLADFGLALKFNQQEVVRGSFGYQAPEVFLLKDEVQCQPSIDVYALGVTVLNWMFRSGVSNLFTPVEISSGELQIAKFMSINGFWQDREFDVSSFRQQEALIAQDSSNPRQAVKMSDSQMYSFIHFVVSCTAYDSKERLNVEQALQHEFVRDVQL